jgi:hypothetical protein
VSERVRRTLLTCRINQVGLDKLNEVAKLASEATGRRVTRSEVVRQMLADGTSRALSARNWTAYRR